MRAIQRNPYARVTGEIVGKKTREKIKESIAGYLLRKSECEL
jgi:hypothetical protein